jgi:hypothetical protein
MKKEVYVKTTLNLPKDLLMKLKKRCINEEISMSKSFRWYLTILGTDKRITRDILEVKDDGI